MNALNQNPDQWSRLFSIAVDLINQVNRDDDIIDHWSLGGGTAMMLQLDHRDSHDVDIFLQRQELLGYLNPELTDFHYQVMPADYSSDGSQFRKFAFEKIGEIDFIVAPDLTELPTERRMIEGVHTQLETIPEIITKKIFYRGATIKPRDIFDIAAANDTYGEEIRTALSGYPDKVQTTLETIDRLNPEFVDGAIEQLMIKDTFRGLAPASLGITKRLLQRSLERT